MPPPPPPPPPPESASESNVSNKSAGSAQSPKSIGALSPGSGPLTAFPSPPQQEQAHANPQRSSRASVALAGIHARASTASSGVRASTESPVSGGLKKKHSAGQSSESVGTPQSLLARMSAGSRSSVASPGQLQNLLQQERAAKRISKKDSLKNTDSESGESEQSELDRTRSPPDSRKGSFDRVHRVPSSHARRSSELNSKPRIGRRGSNASSRPSSMVSEPEQIRSAGGRLQGNPNPLILARSRILFEN